MSQRTVQLCLVVMIVGSITGCGFQSAGRLMPRIDGDWWTVARNPDLGELQGPPDNRKDLTQQPVDFAIWQAADGSWQIWSCIRHTRIGGNTRLFYGWEGRQITDRDWTPTGIRMTGDPQFGENVGGLQAPHVVRIDGIFHMFYGDFVHICLTRSQDGKNFERRLDDHGQAGLFDEGPDCNTRDVMVIRIGDKWYAYYTAHPKIGDRRVGAVYCRISTDLQQWTDATIVARGGQSGDGAYSSECPHVVKVGEYYYLFRTQRYDGPPTTSVYCSSDPLDFGVDTDTKFVCLLPVAAPEIVQYDGQWYIAALLPDIQGIRIAKLKWMRY